MTSCGQLEYPAPTGVNEEYSGLSNIRLRDTPGLYARRARSEPTREPAMSENHPPLTVLASSNCSGKNCPTIYRKDDDTIVVQGYVADNLFATELPAGERAVAIPVSLLKGLEL